MATDRVASSRANWLLIGLLLLMALASWRLVADLRSHQDLVNDLAELRHVKYGMLNVEKWISQVSEIIEIEIREIELDEEQRAAAKAAIERTLDSMLTEVDRQIREQHLSGNWWDRTTGRIKESMRNAVLDIETVKAGIPAYADQILLELEKPETREELGTFLRGLIGNISRETFTEVDETLKREIHGKYGCPGTNSCKDVIKERLARIRETSRYYAAITVICGLLMVLLAGRSAHRGNPLKWVLLALAAMALLLCGILTPMIEVEAQISNLSIVLMSHPVEFYNEVLYFQSKSILDVVSLLIASKELGLLMVGVLLVTFSVIFPSLKLLATCIYAYDVRRWRRSAVVRFFALHSGKWSMADVMVVAMLMAYIGFNGLISDQLELIRSGAASAGVEVITTNGTTLQLGFYMFLSFCLFSLVVSGMMEAALSGREKSPAPATRPPASS